MKSNDEKHSRQFKGQLVFLLKQKRVCVGLGIVVCLALLMASVPLAGKWYLQYWLKANGADEVTISTLFFNPFVGRLRLEGVDVIGGDQSLLTSSKSNIKLDLFPLLKKEVRVVQANYEQLNIYLQQHDDGRWTIASYTTSGEKTVETELVGDDPPVDERSSWAFGIDELTVENCTIHLVTPKISSEIIIEQASLTNFSTREGAEPAELSINGRLGAVPISIELTTLSLFPHLVVSGSVDIKEFDTAVIKPFLESSFNELEGLVSLKGRGDFDGSAEKPTFSYRGDLLVEKGKTATDDLVIAVEKLTYQGEVTNRKNADKLLLDGLLQSSGLALQMPANELLVQNQQFNMDGTINIGVGDQMTLESQLNISAAELKLSAGEMKYDHQRLLWDGTVANKGDLRYLLDGALTVEALNFTDGAMQAASDRISITGQTSVNTGTPLLVESTAEITGKLLNLVFPEASYSHQNISWSGKLHYSPASLGGDGTLRFVDMNVVAASPVGPVDSSLSELAWSGLVNYSLTETELFSALLLDGKLNARVLELNLPGSTPFDVSLASVAFNSLQVGKEGIRLDEIKLTDVKLFSPLATRTVLDTGTVSVSNLAVAADWSVVGELAEFDAIQLFPSAEELQHSAKLSQLKLHKPTYSKQAGVGFGKITGNDLAISLIRDESGSFNWGENLASISDTVTKAEDVSVRTEKEQNSLPVKIDLVEFTGENLIHFVDHTLAIPFKADVVLQKVLVERIDTSGAGDGINVDIAAQLEGRAPLSIAGTLQPFATVKKKDNSAKLDFKLRNYPLANLSPYLVQSVGTGIESGQLKMTGHLTLHNNVLDVRNDLLIKKLTTKAVSPELANQLDNKLPIPLEAALDLLKDSNDNISLSVPINGPLDQIDIDLSDAFITALSKAIVPAASSYLMYALGPYGALAYVGMKLGENILQIELPPVEFQPGEKDLTPEHRDYLARIGALLNDKKSTNDMQICPVVNVVTELGVEGEIVVDELPEAQREELKELGQQRARLVFDYLVDEQAVDADRLLLCITRLVKNEDSRVELQPEQ